MFNNLILDILTDITFSLQVSKWFIKLTQLDSILVIRKLPPFFSGSLFMSKTLQSQYDLNKNILTSIENHSFYNWFKFFLVF